MINRATAWNNNTGGVVELHAVKISLLDMGGDSDL